MYLIGQFFKTNDQYFLSINSFKISGTRVNVGVGVGTRECEGGSLCVHLKEDGCIFLKSRGAI